jgi:hypothetical protein
MHFLQLFQAFQRKSDYQTAKHAAIFAGIGDFEQNSLKQL